MFNKDYKLKRINNRVNKVSINYLDLVNNFSLFKNIFIKYLNLGKSYNILFTTVFNSLEENVKQPLFRKSSIHFYMYEKLDIELSREGFLKLIEYYRRRVIIDENLLILLDEVLKGKDIDYQYYIPLYTNYLEDKVIDKIRKIMISKIEFLLDYYHFELGQPLAVIIHFYDNEKVILKNFKDYKSSSVLKMINVSTLKKITSPKFLPLSMDFKYYGNLVKNKDYVLNNSMINNINNNNNINYKDIDKFSIFNYDFVNFYKDKLFIFDYKFYNFDNKYLVVLRLDRNYIWVFNKETFSLDYYCIDNKLSDKLFERIINDKKIYISDLKVEYLINKLQVNSLSLPLNSGIQISESLVKIGTLDLECFNNKNQDNYVYAIGYSIFKKNRLKDISFNDLNMNIYYLEDYKDYNHPSINMVIECIMDMLLNYSNYTFYVHNLGGYDSIYLLNSLIKYNKSKAEEDQIKFDLIYRDANILKMNLWYVYKNKRFSINICDSLALLNINLNSLCEIFNLPSNFKKDLFPYDFVNYNNLDYVGNIPDLKYYEGISKDQYVKEFYDYIYNNKTWNLREEVSKYLIKDLGSLLLVIDKFRVFIDQFFDMDIRKNLTISRLALNIFNHKYKELKNIPQIKNDRLYSFIREGLYGGVTSVYYPYGENLYYYDVNSLYPAMALDNFIGGLDISFLYNYGEEELKLEDLFGFFKAEVEIDKMQIDKMQIGLLPLRTKDKGLIFPVGKFNGVWFSEELKFAKNNGYKIKIIEGYNFNKIKSPFKKYILDLYNLKLKNKGGGKFIYKSLLNNLIGRFGIDIKKAVTKLLNQKEFDLVMACCDVISVMEVENNQSNSKFVVKYIPIPVPEKCIANNIDYLDIINKGSKLISMKDDQSIYNDASVMVTAMINSYARIWFNNFKLDLINKGYKIYYCDTDSIVIDKPLDKNFVGEGIGQFKFIAKIKRGYFISNKLYFMIDQFNNIISGSKGINSPLNENDFINLLNNVSINSKTKLSIKNVDEGYVIITDRDIKLNYNSFKKRMKIYDENGRWIGTKPIVVK